MSEKPAAPPVMKVATTDAAETEAAPPPSSKKLLDPAYQGTVHHPPASPPRSPGSNPKVATEPLSIDEFYRLLQEAPRSQVIRAHKNRVEMDREALAGSFGEEGWLAQSYAAAPMDVDSGWEAEPVEKKRHADEAVDRKKRYGGGGGGGDASWGADSWVDDGWAPWTPAVEKGKEADAWGYTVDQPGNQSEKGTAGDKGNAGGELHYARGKPTNLKPRDDVDDLLKQVRDSVAKNEALLARNTKPAEVGRRITGESAGDGWGLLWDEPKQPERPVGSREELEKEKAGKMEENEGDKEKPHIRPVQVHKSANSGIEASDKDKDRVEKERRQRDREKDMKMVRDLEPVKERERHKKDRDGNSKREREDVMAVDCNGVVQEPEGDKKPSNAEEGKVNVDRPRDKEGEEKGKDRSHEYEKGEREETNLDETHSDRDKDAVVVQQRKRMLRPRGCQQPASREARSRFRPKDRDGWHGRSESSIITYKIGDGLPELTKLWKDVASNSEGANSGSTPTLDVRIPAELATTSNRQFRGSQLWGTDIYTDDSDLLAVLKHTGYYCPTASPPPPCILELRATIRVLPPQNSYKSTLRNNVRSRAWGAASGCSYSIDRCRIVMSGGAIKDLEPCLNRMPIAPTLAPAAMERTMTTRAASSNAHRQQRFVQEVTVQYNLCNEPWLKYSMSIVADRGLKKPLFTSARLKKGDVLYLETLTHRYELSYDGEKASCNGTVAATTATSVALQGPVTSEKVKDKAASDKEKAHSHLHSGERTSMHGSSDKNGHGGQSGEYAEHYKWGRCIFPLPLAAVRVKGVPLPPEYVQVLEDGLTWEEVQWSPTGVWIRGKEFILARAQFLSPHVDTLEA